MNQIVEWMFELLLGAASCGAFALLLIAIAERWVDRRSLWSRLVPSDRDHLEELAASHVEYARLEGVIARLVERYDGGVVRWGHILTKAAPLLGLIGTLFGVSVSLQEFVANPADPRTFIRGFSLAISATMLGVLVSLVSLVTVRWVRLPLLAAWEAEVLQQLTTAAPSRTRKMSSNGHRVAPSSPATRRPFNDWEA